MPYKKNYRPRKRNSKSRWSVRKKKKAYIRRMPKAGTLGNRLVKKFRYVDRINLDATSVAADVHTFCANGLYDPDITGTGHQPIGFDQLMSFYNHYTVIGAKIRVDYLPNSTSPTTAQSYVGIEMSGNVTPVTTIPTLFEQGNSVYRVLGTANSGRPLSLTKKCSMKRELSQPPMSCDENAGTASTNPSEKVYFHIWQTAISSSFEPTAVNCLVTIDFVAVLHEPLALTGS